MGRDRSPMMREAGRVGDGRSRTAHEAVAEPVPMAYLLVDCLRRIRPTLLP